MDSSPSASNEVARMMPRVVQRRKKPAAPRSVPMVSSSPSTSSKPSSSGLVAMDDDMIMEGAAKALEKMILDPEMVKEQERLAILLYALETCLSDWSLSVHKSTGLLQKIRDSPHGDVHLQFFLSLQRIEALTNSIADLQKALRSKQSSSVTISESGFHVRRKRSPDFDRLESLKPENWEPMSLYLENVPPISTGSTPHALSSRLSLLLKSQIQTVVLPPLFVVPPRANVTSPSTSTTVDENSQAEFFLRSKKPERLGERMDRPWALPFGGGPFKGFAFVIVDNEEEASRILKEWPWDKQKNSEDSGMEVDERSEADKLQIEREKAARTIGFRALSYSRWRALKEEYLAYQLTLSNLRERPIPQPATPTTLSSIPETQFDESSSSSSFLQPRLNRALPPHLTSNRILSAPKRGHEEESQDRAGTSKRAKVSQAPLTNQLEEDGDESFPEGCVLWLRCLNENSSKAILRSLFNDIIDELEATELTTQERPQGMMKKGKGIEFVDYEKGLDHSHIRFHTAYHASLLYTYLASDSPKYHLSPTYLSDSPDKIDLSRNAIKVERIEGERERIYWSRLSEAAWRGAREAARVRARIDSNDDAVDSLQGMTEVTGETLAEVGAVDEKRKRRKKPN